MRCFQIRPFVICTTIACASAAQADENVMIVFDGSNSMWGQIEGTAKIEIARDVMDNLLGDWVEDRQVGLMAYGHRRRGDCTDIEVLVPPGTAARDSIVARIAEITPTGKTPLTDAVEAAAKTLSYTDQPATVVLISDGLESCERDPCALAAALEQGGVGFTAHVVGFGLGQEEDAASLACIAENTGGQYIAASNAQELGAALSAVSSSVAEPAPAPEPEPEPEPATPEVIVQAPATAVGGSDVTVTWSPTVEEADYITIVPVGSDEDTFGTYARIGAATEVTLPVSGATGLYEARYLHNATKTTLGFAPIEVTKPEVTLTAPDMVQTGAAMEIAWTPTINKRDYVTIVPAGSDAGTLGAYSAIGRFTETTLDAPADPGLYEIRYVLNVDKQTVASRPLEVTDTSVVLQVPDTAQTGADFEIGWSAAVNARDYITIVPVGAEDGSYDNYILVRDEASGELKAPAEPGMYEVRYILREGAKTLASEMIEITAPDVTISGPAQVATGAPFTVSWAGTVNTQDYVAIVPAGADEGTYGNYSVVRDKSEATLTAQADPGLYELRYILREGNKTLASVPIEVTEPEVTINGPEQVATGARFSISWTGTVAPNDYVAIVPAGSEEGTYGNYVAVRDRSEAELTAQADPGLYELRYILREGNKTLVSVPIELTIPEVTVSAPEQVRAGDKLKVAWTGAVSQQDYIALVPMGTPDDKLGTYGQVRDADSRELEAPDDTGMYEVRYVLREGSRVLARQMVEVLPQDAALNTGAAITAPESAAAGATIEVNWTVDSDSADQRITLARGNQAIFTWISAEKISGDGPISLTLPSEPGVYEIRFLDVSNQAVLSRHVIKVE